MPISENVDFLISSKAQTLVNSVRFGTSLYWTDVKTLILDYGIGFRFARMLVESDIIRRENFRRNVG